MAAWLPDSGVQLAILITGRLASADAGTQHASITIVRVNDNTKERARFIRGLLLIISESAQAVLRISKKLPAAR
jgi:hypothetical protein